LYESEIWSPTLREGHRLRVFENRVLSIILKWILEENVGKMWLRIGTSGGI
jgi:hypothetical protein